MDKTAIGLMADVLYIKGYINFDEYEAIMNIKTPTDVDALVERLLTDGKEGGFNGNKGSKKVRGEGYLDYGTRI